MDQESTTSYIGKKDTPGVAQIWCSLIALISVVVGVIVIGKYFPLKGEIDLPDSLRLLGRFHPVIVHFPLGVLYVVGGLEFLTTKNFRSRIAPTTTILLWITLATGIVASVAGYLLAGEGGASLEKTERHMYLAFSMLVLTGIALLFKVCYENSKTWINKNLYCLFLLFSLIALFLAGHVGGELTHGSKYLKKYMPDFLLKMENGTFKFLDDQVERVSGIRIMGTDDLEPIENKDIEEKPKSESWKELSFYHSTIQPIFDSKCVSCHGEDKTKGKLRMDSFEAVMKGGSEGDHVIFGDVEASLLTYRIGLPLDDDEHMPPEDKEQLTVDEIGLIKEWVLSGADQNVKINQLSVSDSVMELIKKNHVTNEGEVSE